MEIRVVQDIREVVGAYFMEDKDDIVWPASPLVLEWGGQRHMMERHSITYLLHTVGWGKTYVIMRAAKDNPTKSFLIVTSDHAMAEEISRRLKEEYDVDALHFIGRNGWYDKQRGINHVRCLYPKEERYEYECKGCEYRRRCEYVKQKRRAETVQVVVTVHHCLYLATDFRHWDVVDFDESAESILTHVYHFSEKFLARHNIRAMDYPKPIHKKCNEGCLQWRECCSRHQARKNDKCQYMSKIFHMEMRFKGKPRDAEERFLWRNLGWERELHRPQMYLDGNEYELGNGFREVVGIWDFHPTKKQMKAIMKDKTAWELYNRMEIPLKQFIDIWRKDHKIGCAQYGIIDALPILDCDYIIYCSGTTTRSLAKGWLFREYDPDYGGDWLQTKQSNVFHERIENPVTTYPRAGSIRSTDDAIKSGHLAKIVVDMKERCGVPFLIVTKKAFEERIIRHLRVTFEDLVVTSGAEYKKEDDADIVVAHYPLMGTNKFEHCKGVLITTRYHMNVAVRYLIASQINDEIYDGIMMTKELEDGMVMQAVGRIRPGFKDNDKIKHGDCNKLIIMDARFEHEQLINVCQKDRQKVLDSNEIVREHMRENPGMGANRSFEALKRRYGNKLVGRNRFLTLFKKVKEGA